MQPPDGGKRERNFSLRVLMGGNKLDEGDISIRWIVSAGGMVFTAGEFVEPSHG